MKPLLLAYVLLVTACSSPVSPSKTARLTVQVVDAETGAPIQSAGMMAAGSNAVTGADGRAALDIPANVATLVQFSATGFESRAQPYRVAQATETAVGLHRLK